MGEFESRPAALCRLARRLSTTRSRERRGPIYVSSALALAGARYAAVAWRRRRELIVIELAAGGDVTRREYPLHSEYCETFDRALALPEGTLPVGVADATWTPPGLTESEEATLVLPEGRSRGAPRLFIQSGGNRRLADYRSLLHAIRPHWIRRRQLRRRASTDHLTGVSNYRHLRRYLKRACQEARSGGPRFSVLMLDLDHLREYNTEFGHLMGSRVLAQLGDLLRRSLRGADLVAKYGGDEFIAVLPGASKADAVGVALRLKDHISRQSFYGVSSGYITCSIGVATFGEDGTSYQKLVGAADRAIFAAKDRGRNTVVAAGREKPGDIEAASG